MLNRWAGLGRGLLALAIALSLTAGSLFSLAAPAGAQADAFSTASAVPADAVLYGAIDLDFEAAQWQTFEALLSRLGVPDALDQLRTGILEDADDEELTEAELDAFLGGEVGFFLLPGGVEAIIDQVDDLNQEMTDMAAASPEALEDMDMTDLGGDFVLTGVGAVFEPSDVEAAWDSVNRQLADQIGAGEVRVEESTYGDVAILTVTPSNGAGSDTQGGVVAQVGDFIILGGDVADVETVIDTVNGEADALADLGAYADVAAELPAESIFFAYYDGGQVNDVLSADVLEGLANLSPQLAQSLEVDYYGGTAFWTDEQGFRLDSVTIPAEGGDLSGMVPEGTVTFDQRVPAATTIFLGGIVPPGTWNAAAVSAAQAINAGVSGTEPEVQSLDEMFSDEYVQAQLAQAEQVLGFNLLDDFFGQFQGELAFALTFPDMMTMSELSVDTVFVTELDDAAPVADSVETLVRMFSSMAGGELSVTTRAMGDDTLYLLGDSTTTGIPTIAVGVVEGRLLLGTETGVDNFLFMDDVGNALVDDPQYQAALAAFPDEEHYQIAYIDLTDIIPTIMALSGMTGDMGAGMGQMTDADPACLEFSSQEEAQAAFEEDMFTNSNLDQDFDGQACEDFFAPAVAQAQATPIPTGSIEALETFAAVAYERDGNLYSSAILFVAEIEE